MNSYRPEIDGLRAIAVLSVLLFHLGLPTFSGGYVGVDVFFVISGYLITRLIRADVTAGRFTFRRFYVRRTRRLFPALFFTLALSTIAACLLFSPGHLASFARSLIAAILSVSNILFWRESGYFDLAASVKPLLHTWSLGVEEQFYFLWPLMLFLLLRRSAAAAIGFIVIGGIVSFGLNLIFASGQSPLVQMLPGRLAARFVEGPSTIFYLLPFRVFEFAIGAGMVWIAERQPRGATALEPLLVVGLALIAWPVFAYTEKTLFPSYNALAPCIGTALVIYAGSARYAGLILRIKVARGIGLISYSLYLIHWPLIVFWRYYTLHALSAPEQAAISAIAIAAATLMYFYVEKPFRGEKRLQVPQLPFVTAAILASSAVLVIAAEVDASGGWPDRIPASRYIMASDKFEALETANCGQPTVATALITCSAERGSAKSIYVWGDSHARYLISGLAEVYPDHNIRIFYFTGCRPQSGLFGYRYDYEGRAHYADACAKRNQDAMALLLQSAPTNVILHWYVNEGESESPVLTVATKGIIDALSAHGHNVKILGDVIRPSIYLPDCYAVPITISDARRDMRCPGDKTIADGVATVNARYATMFGGHFVNPNAVFSSNDRYITSAEGELLFRDTNHLTPFGSRYMIGRLKPDFNIM